jgi:hypothetical protein
MGGGTLLVVVAENLGPESPWRSILLYIAPSVSVLAGAVWWWVQIKVANWLRDREFISILREGQATLRRQLAEATDPAEKVKIEQRLQAFREAEANRYFEKIKVFNVVSEAEPKLQTNQLER